MTDDRHTLVARTRRVVVKVGSNVLTQDNGLNVGAIESISNQLCQLIDDGREVILVSSGAMASGMRKLGLQRRPDAVPERQAVSAVGQAGLMEAYEHAFSRCRKQVAQILLTSDDLSHRKRYLNSRNALLTLLSWKVIPIINENDTVMVEEIQFGDNDTLAAMISLLMEADLLINLTDIGGLFDRDPRTDPQAVLIPVVHTIDAQLEALAGEIPGALGTGGMRSKIAAAKKLSAAGVPMIIANGNTPDILLRIIEGEALGTFFVPNVKSLNSRKRWLAYSLKPKGVLVIDKGAAAAVVRNGKSLLPSGITRVEGNFSSGAPVRFDNEDGVALGVGLVNYGSDDLRRIQGLKTSQIRQKLGYRPYDEVIHRDNLAITADNGR
jgi:glutamate 5-kinase